MKSLTKKKIDMWQTQAYRRRKTQNVSKNEEETIRDSRRLGGGEGSRKEEDDVSLNHVTHARLSFFFSFFFPSLFLSRRGAKKDEKKHNIKKLRLMLYVR